MTLRPAANLFAVWDPDPGFIGHLQAELDDSRAFDEVWRPAPGWFCAQALLPESEPDGAQVRSRGFAFIEGRDRLEVGLGAKWLDQTERLTDTSPGRLHELPGDFAFVRFRPDGTALAVRACAGLAPVYMLRRPQGGLAIGTLLSYFPRFLPERFRPDPLITATCDINNRFIDARCFVEGVSLIEPGSYVGHRPGHSPTGGRYWDPRPQAGNDPQPDPEHSRELRRLLIETLERDLDPSGRNLLALSGGVDSSSLAALSAGTLGKRISTWSRVPTEEPERSHELSYIEPLIEAYEIAPVHLSERPDEERRLWRVDPPGLPFQIVHPVHCELPRICETQEVRVLFGGEFGDEVCGQWIRITDWCRTTSLWQLLTHPRNLPFGSRDYLRWGRRRLRDAMRRPLTPYTYPMPGWVHPEIVAEYHEWLRRDRASRARDERPLKDLAAGVDANAWVPANWEAVTPLGIRRCLPFHTREMLEFAFSCHPRELLGPGTKLLLRQALRDDVPSRNLNRPDRGQWGKPLEVQQRHVDRIAEVASRADPVAIEQLVRPGWLSHGAANASWGEAFRLLYAVHVAAYLNRN